MMEAMYLLTEWEGWMGKYLAPGPYLLTEKQIFYHQPDLTQSISIKVYHMTTKC